jgi:hypothetical protein
MEGGRDVDDAMHVALDDGAAETEAAPMEGRRFGGAAGSGGGGGGGGGWMMSRMFRSSRTRRDEAAAVDQLVAMGFEQGAAEEAVAQVGPDPNLAVEFILGHDGDADDGGGGRGAVEQDEEEEDDEEEVPRRRRPGDAADMEASVGADAAEALIRALDSPDQTGRLRDLFESMQHEQDGGDVQWGQLLQVLLSRVQPVERNDGVTEQRVSEALPETTMTEERLSAHGDDSGECACPLCMEAIKVGERMATLPCGHLYHRSPALPTEHELPKTVTVNEHECTLVNFEQLSYSAWICDVCLRNQGKGGTFFHDGPIGTPNDNGFDCCVRCAQKHGALGEEMAAGCGGIDAWLMTNPTCPTCRAPALPKATAEAAPGGAGGESQMQAAEAAEAEAQPRMPLAGDAGEPHQGIQILRVAPGPPPQLHQAGTQTSEVLVGGAAAADEATPMQLGAIDVD